jgi:hypothetical protein
MNLNIPDSKIAWESNFEIKFTMFDNLKWIINQTDYNLFNIDYSYKIEADENSITSSSQIIPNTQKIDTFSIKNATEKNKKFKIIFTLTDKAGNTNEIEKDFIIYPWNLNENKSELILSSIWDKYANNSDYYEYTLILKDLYWNNIYDKKADIKFNTWSWTKIIYTDIFNSGSTQAISLFDNIGNVSDWEWNIYFKLKSLAPWEFSQHFDISIKKWWDDYINVLDNVPDNVDNLFKILSDTNLFKKPISWEFNIIEWWDFPEIWKIQKYNINLTNSWNINNYSSWKLNISESTIIHNIEWYSWNKFDLMNNEFWNDISANILSFSWLIDVEDNISELLNIWIKDLFISYELWWENIKYYLDDFWISWIKEEEWLDIEILE